MKVISLGLGVQSTAMYLMSSLGDLPRADHAVFADPGAEHPKTYELMDFVLNWQRENDGIPIIIREKSIKIDILRGENSTGQRFASIPAYTNEGKGQLRRQCTKEYKIDPVMKAIRELYGLKAHKRMPMTEVWLGISMDELQRMKISILPRVNYYYPLYENRIYRSGCMDYLKSHGFPEPVKSACVFCPYQSDKRWKGLKDSGNGQWKLCLDVDESIRDSSKRGAKEPIYLHRSGIPLERVQFADQVDLFDDLCDGGYCGL